MTLNCLIVDDEPLALDLLESYVGRTPFLKLCGRAGSALEAMQLLDRVSETGEHVDLLFLDIQMPQLSGIEFSRLLSSRSEAPGVIFTTAFGQYALEGFRTDALDYLLKPVSYPEFLKAAMKAQRWLQGPAHKTDSGGADSIWVRANYRQVRIPLADVLYIESMKDYVHIHMEGGEVVETQMTLKRVHEQLAEEKFMRVHRSFIVNLEQVSTLERNRIVFGKTYIPVSDTVLPDLLRLLAVYAAES